MEYKSVFSFLILLCLFISSCGDNSGTSEKEISEDSDKQLDSTVVFPDSINIDSVTPKFYDKAPLNRYQDSLRSYFKNIFSYLDLETKTEYDTINNANHTEFKVILIDKGDWGWRPLLSTSIYVFHNVLDATDFYNDLKTQEYIVPFGLNKRPNHIVVSDNVLVWLTFEHSYGHRYKELAHLFNVTTGFKANGTNADSVAGFNYCSCHNQPAYHPNMIGKWKVVKTLRAPSNTGYYDNPDINIHPLLEDPDSFELTVDSLFIGALRLAKDPSHNSAIPLPSMKYYVQYRFEDQSYPTYEDGDLEAMNQLKDWMKTLKYPDQGLIQYRYRFRSHDVFIMFQLDDGRTFARYNNLYFQLRKL